MTTIYAEGSNEYKPSKFTCMQPAQSQNGSNPSTFRRARLQPLKFSLCGEHARLQSFKFSVCGEFETITILQIFRECSKRLQSFKISACGVLKTNTILSKRLQPFFFRQRRAQNNYTPYPSNFQPAAY